MSVKPAGEAGVEPPGAGLGVARETVDGHPEWHCGDNLTHGPHDPPNCMRSASKIKDEANEAAPPPKEEKKSLV